MRERFLLLVGVWALVLVAAFAQTSLNPPPSPTGVNPPPSPTPSPTPSSQRPTGVLTPTSDAQLNAAGQPLTPMRPEPETETMLEPEAVEQEALGTEEAILADERERRRWRIIPLFSAGVEYNDNIFVSQDRVSDVIWKISGGLIYELGDFRGQEENYLSAQWIGQPVIYTENSAQNAFNQYVSLQLQYRFTKLVMKFNSTYSIVKGPNRDVNTITTTQTIWNYLLFRYDYSDKTDFNLAFTQSSSLTQDFQNTSSYQASAGMDYQLFPKTRVGFQGVAGVLVSTDTPVQYLQQALMRVSYGATGKVSFYLNGGVQFLEVEDLVKIDPVFSLGVSWEPFPGTSVSLIGFRNVVGSSSEAGQDYFATGFELGLQQRFFQKFVAAVNFGYENDTYFGTTSDTPSNRVDDYVFVRPRLTYAFVDWFSASIFYEFRQTTSTQETSNFSNNRAGLEILTKF